MPLAGLLVFVAGLCLVPVTETDLFFRLAAGREFLRTGHGVHENLFSFTYPHEPYRDPAWLFDVGAAVLYRWGGFPALVIAKTFVVLATFWLAYRFARSQGAKAIPTVLLLAAAAYCFRERLVERPHIFSLLGCVLVMSMLPKVVAGRSTAYWLFPVTILWANLHAGAFLAPLIIGARLLPALITRDPTARPLGLFLLLTTVSLFLTPVGLGLFHYLAFHTTIFALHPVDEFRSITWRSDTVFIVFLVGCTLCLVARRPPWGEVLPALFLTMLALRHVRFISEAALVAALVTAPSLSRSLDSFLLSRKRLLEVGVGIGLGAVAIIPRLAQAGSALNIGLDVSALPEQALRFVEKNGLRERMYNDFETGAYLLWQGYPRYRVFVDPRLPAYPAAFHQLLGKMHIPRKEWTQAMDQLGIESALLDYAGINRRVAFWDPEDYALVFRAENCRVFVRRLPKWRNFIAAHEIPAYFEFTVEEGAQTLPLLAPPRHSPVPECEWNLRLGDLCFELDGGRVNRSLTHIQKALSAPTGCLHPEREAAAAAWLGSEELKARRYNEALTSLHRALAFSPNDTALLTNRALAYEAEGRHDAARSDWIRIAELAAGTELGEKARKKSGR
jgi:tetratricopeptide (TPR) repeat protein